MRVTRITIVVILCSITSACIVEVTSQVISKNPVQGSNMLSSVMTSKKNSHKSSAGLPVQLSIPSISISTSIMHVGLKADGSMDIDKNPDQVAWYEFGPRPGDEGSAVIAGHYGWTGSHGSVFNDLHLLAKGDEVSIRDQKNIVTVFIVSKIQKYDPKANATDIFQSYDSKAHLNLVTCDGAWVNSTHSYSDRLVVFTDLKQ